VKFKPQTALFFIFKSVLTGLLMAAIILLLFPEMRAGLSVRNLVSSEPEPLPVFSFNEAVRRAAPAVVNVYTRSLQPNPFDSESVKLRTKGLGSGVLMSSKGYVLTNYHVISEANQIIVALQDGRIFTAKLVGYDIYTDLAVLLIEADRLPEIPQDPQVKPEVGDLVLAIGNPYNLGQTITQGIIGATGRAGMASTSYQDFLQTDAAINQGNSGGALINSQGILIGINTSAFQAARPNQVSAGISFAIPYHLAYTIMTKLIAEGRVVRGYLGITGQQLNAVAAKQLKLGTRTGVVIENLEAGGPADQAGLLPDDVMIKIDGQAVQGVHHAMESIAETRPGEIVTITVIRRGETLDIQVKVSEPPPATL
jgi:serine protease DegS